MSDHHKAVVYPSHSGARSRAVDIQLQELLSIWYLVQLAAELFPHKSNGASNHRGEIATVILVRTGLDCITDGAEEQYFKFNARTDRLENRRLKISVATPVVVCNTEEQATALGLPNPS